MATQVELLGVLIALEFVVVAAFVFVSVPVHVAAPVLPLAFVFLVALYGYLS